MSIYLAAIRSTVEERYAVSAHGGRILYRLLSCVIEYVLAQPSVPLYFLSRDGQMMASVLVDRKTRETKTLRNTVQIFSRQKIIASFCL